MAGICVLAAVLSVLVYRQGLRDGKVLHEGGSLKTGIRKKRNGQAGERDGGGWDGIMNYDHNGKDGGQTKG